jgi:amino acid transporter
MSNSLEQAGILCNVGWLTSYRGFAVGWEYAIGWLTLLPFEITAAGITIKFWTDDINIGVWAAVLITVLAIVQFFGVRGYGEGFYLIMLYFNRC